MPLDVAVLYVTCDTKNAVIYYTTDGSQPTEDSPAIIEGSAPLSIDDVTVHEINLFALAEGYMPGDMLHKDLSIMYKEKMPSFDPPPGMYQEFSLEIATSCEEGEQDIRIHYTTEEKKAPDRTSRYVHCGDTIIIGGPGTIYFRAFAISDNMYQSDVFKGDYILVKPAYDSYPVGSIDFHVLPRYQVHVVEKNLQSSDPYHCSNRNIRGRLIVLENPIGHFDFIEPAGGCGAVSLPSVTGASFVTSHRKSRVVMDRYKEKESLEGLFSIYPSLHKSMHDEFEALKDSGCLVVTNAGFFNTSNHECLGDIVSQGELVQTSTTGNVNFGIRNGNFVVGNILSKEIKHDDPFDTLISGIVWLVRKGQNYVRESLIDGEDMSAQTTGKQFASVLSARTAIGHDDKGRLMILQVEGETWIRGMTLYEFADFAVENGCTQQ